MTTKTVPPCPGRDTGSDSGSVEDDADAWGLATEPTGKMRSYFGYASASGAALRFVTGKMPNSTFSAVYAIEPTSAELHLVAEFASSAIALLALHLCIDIANGVVSEAAGRSKCERLSIAAEKIPVPSDYEAVYERQGEIQRSLVESARTVPLTKFGTLLCDRREIRAMFVSADKDCFRILVELVHGTVVPCFKTLIERDVVDKLDEFRRRANAQFVNPDARKDFGCNGSEVATVYRGDDAASRSAKKPHKEKRVKRVVSLVPKTKLSVQQRQIALKRKQDKIDLAKADGGDGDDDDVVDKAELSDMEEVEDFVTDDEYVSDDDEGSRDHETKKPIANPREFKDNEAFHKSMDSMAIEKAKRDGYVETGGADFDDDDGKIVNLRDDIAIDSSDDDDEASGEMREISVAVPVVQASEAAETELDDEAVKKV